MSRSLLVRWFFILLALLAVLVLLIGVWTYTWTYTDEGRMDYRAALIARLIDSQSQQDFKMNAQARARSNANTLRWLGERELLPVAEIRQLEVPADNGRSISVRAYFPEADHEAVLPVYVMVHGGGFWMGDDFRIEEPQARLMANRAEVIVLAVDYRLAPEHPYPAGLEDCYAVLLWAFENAAHLGGDPDRIAVGGGSAGGNLSAAMALKARDEGGPSIRFLLPIMPVTNLSDEIATNSPAKQQYVLKAEHMLKMRVGYVPDPSQRSHPYVSPLLANDHSGLPPTYIITAQFDPLRDQGEAFGEKIRAAGGQVTIKRYPGVLHGFLGTPDVAQMALTEAAIAMKAALQVQAR